MPYWAVTGQGSSFLLWRCLSEGFCLINISINLNLPALHGMNQRKRFNQAFIIDIHKKIGLFNSFLYGYLK